MIYNTSNMRTYRECDEDFEEDDSAWDAIERMQNDY